MESTTTEPPFYISDATDMGNKNYENFKSAVNIYQIQSSIAKGSIVRILDRDKNKSSNNDPKYIGVEVLSTPQQSETTTHTWAQPREKGFIYYDSLVLPSTKVQQKASSKDQVNPQKNGEYEFEVNRKVPFLLAGDLQLTKGQHLKLSTVTDSNGVSRFKIRECCEQIQTANADQYENRNCKIEYSFGLLAENKTHALREFYFDPNEQDCDKNMTNFITPNLKGELKRIAAIIDQQQDQFRPATTYVNPEAIKTAGVKPNTFLAPSSVTNENGKDLSFAKILLVQKLASKGPNSVYDWYEGPYGSYHYNIRPETVGRAQTSGEKDAICAFTHVVKEQQAACNGGATCKLFFGDFYSPLSEKARDSRGKELNRPIHYQHFTGRCVDIQIGSIEVKNNSVAFQRYNSKNSAFTELVAGYGGDVLDHGDHMHVCFKKPDKFTYSKMRDCLENPWQYEKSTSNSLAFSN